MVEIAGCCQAGGVTAPPAPAPSPAAAGLGAAATRMRAIAAELPPGDGLAVFNGIYLTVTEEVLRRIGSAGFADSASAGHLAAVFAGRYLAAVDADRAGLRPPACWRPLFTLRGHPGIHPVQFALAGMNAHIEHDLPLSVLDTCLSLAREPEQLAADYERINGLLAELDEKVRAELLPGPDPLELAEPLTHLVGAWSVSRARDAAWTTAKVLWGLRELPEILEEFSSGLDRTVGLVGRQLLTPLA
jgi:hypothetical protein